MVQVCVFIDLRNFIKGLFFTSSDVSLGANLFLFLFITQPMYC